VGVYGTGGILVGGGFSLEPAIGGGIAFGRRVGIGVIMPVRYLIDTFNAAGGTIIIKGLGGAGAGSTDEQGIATVEDIDKGLRLAAGRKMGIFETGDMVGLDVTYGALMAMYKETGDPRWYPPLLLRRKIKAGHLGRKTGKGWYAYNSDGSRK